jgi:CRISPR-associated endonuclease Cas2
VLPNGGRGCTSCCLDTGKWAQYSVFECFLTAVQFVKLQQQVEQLIKPVEDSVRIYVLDAGRREADDYLWFPAT